MAGQCVSCSCSFLWQQRLAAERASEDYNPIAASEVEAVQRMRPAPAADRPVVGVGELIAAAVPRIGEWYALSQAEQVIAKINPAMCVNCGSCYSSCNDSGCVRVGVRPSARPDPGVSVCLFVSSAVRPLIRVAIRGCSFTPFQPRRAWRLKFDTVTDYPPAHTHTHTQTRARADTSPSRSTLRPIFRSLSRRTARAARCASVCARSTTASRWLRGTGRTCPTVAWRSARSSISSSGWIMNLETVAATAQAPRGHGSATRPGGSGRPNMYFAAPPSERQQQQRRWQHTRTPACRHRQLGVTTQHERLVAS